MSNSVNQLNQKISNLYALVSQGGISSQNLEQILDNGNDAGNLNIIGVDNLAVTTINSASYPPVVASATLSSVLTNGNTATDSITLNNSPGTKVISLLPIGATNPSNPEIVLTNGTLTNTINHTGYRTIATTENDTHYLNFSDSSSTGVGAIQKTPGLECNPSTKTITASFFSGLATNTNNVFVATNNGTNASFYPTFVTGDGSEKEVSVSSDLRYNPSTNTLTATFFDGDVNGATNVDIIEESTDDTFYPTFVNAAGVLKPLNIDNTSLTYNPSTNTLTAENFAGNATNATDVTGTATNATTAATGTAVTITDTDTGIGYPTFVDGAGTTKSLNIDTSTLSFNASTNTLTAATFAGNASSATDASTATGTATNATNAATGTAVTITDTDTGVGYPTFVDGAGTTKSLNIDTSTLSFNASTNTLTATTFAGTATSASLTATGTAVTITDTNTGVGYPTFVDGAGTTKSLNIDTSTLSFNATSNTLTTTNFAGNASTATLIPFITDVTGTADITEKLAIATKNDEDAYPNTFVVATSGNNGLKVDSNSFFYNPFDNSVIATNFAGTANTTERIVTTSSATNADYNLPFKLDGDNSLLVDSSYPFTFNPSTNRMVVSNISVIVSNATNAVEAVTITGNAGSADIADEVTITNPSIINFDNYLTFSSFTFGNNEIKVDEIASITYNPSNITFKTPKLKITAIPSTAPTADNVVWRSGTQLRIGPVLIQPISFYTLSSNLNNSIAGASGSATATTTSFATFAGKTGLQLHGTTYSGTGAFKIVMPNTLAVTASSGFAICGWFLYTGTSFNINWLMKNVAETSPSILFACEFQQYVIFTTMNFSTNWYPGGTSRRKTFTTISTAKDVWYFLSWNFVGTCPAVTTTPTAEMYLNGSIVSIDPLVSPAGTAPGAFAYNSTALGNSLTFVGNAGIASTKNLVMRNIGFYNRVLTASEMLAIFNLGLAAT